MERIGSKIVRWVDSDTEVSESLNSSRSLLVRDRYDQQVFLFENEFALRWFKEKNPDVKLSSPIEEDY